MNDEQGERKLPLDKTQTDIQHVVTSLNPYWIGTCQQFIVQVTPAKLEYMKE